MKKLLAIFLVLSLVILTVSAALADDLSALSDEELITLCRNALDELERRGLEPPEETGEEETHPALQRLVDFYLYWNRNQHDEMLELCLPEWKAQCENPRIELFKALMNRTPNSLEIVKTEPGNPDDSVLTVTVITEVDRNNGSSPNRYLLRIRMEKSADGLWYVNPSSLIPGESAEDLPEAEPTHAPEEGDATAAEEEVIPNRIMQFFVYWNNGPQLDKMLDLCLPEWKESCESPRLELFRILQNRTPDTLEILKTEPGNPEDSVLIVTVISELSRNNGTAAEKYRLQIRMEKSADGLWYVDPQCLYNYETIADLPEAESTPVPAPEAHIPVVIAASEPSEGNLFQSAATDEDNLVVQRMAEFFAEWSEDDLDGMLAYCMPEWQLKQESAKTALFALLLNRTPQSVTIEGITPAEPEDTFRRVLVDTEMDRHNGEDPAHFLLVIWMVRSGDGLWYFDPGCLENPDRLDLVTQAEPTPDPAAVEQFGDSADTILYYNPSGGEYYHRDPNCKNVNPKFRPLEGTFRFYEINDEPYCHLKRCNVCGAPIRP